MGCCGIGYYVTLCIMILGIMTCNRCTRLLLKFSLFLSQELQCLQSDEIVLVCKLEEEFGFKSEQQLKESVDFQTEQLSKMDEKLIQLFEVLYILETAEANFEDELHLAASEGAVLTKSRVLTTVSSTVVNISGYYRASFIGVPQFH